MKRDFNKDNPWGVTCERVFAEIYGGYVRQIDGLRGDLVLLRRNGELVELKSESYSTNTDPFSDENMKFRRDAGIPDPPGRGWAPSKNIAVERWSSESEEKPGGPWQAQKNGVKWYVHFFAGDGEVFAYRTADLVKFMDRALEEDPGRFWKIPFDNGEYTTITYVVPREAVMHLEVFGLFEGDGIRLGKWKRDRLEKIKARLRTGKRRR